MKRIAPAGLMIALTGALLALMTAAASASGITFGAACGLSSSNTTEVPAGWSGTSFRNGFAGGASLNVPIDDNFSIQPEVLYVQKGLDGSLGRGSFGYTFAARYDYIEIPVLARYKVTTKSRVIPYLIVGPCLGINVAANVDLTFQDPVFFRTASGSVDYSNVMSTTEFSWVFGAGLGVGLGPGEVTFDARLDLGLSKIYTGGAVHGNLGGYPYNDTVYAGTSKNLGFALLIGYTL
jgi:hypothetical protein